MKSDSASILLNLIIEKSAKGLSAEDQMLMDRLIASAPDPLQVASDVRRCEVALATQDFADVPESMRETLRDRLRASSNLKPQGQEMPGALRQAIIVDGMAYVEKAYGSKRTDRPVREFRPRGVPVGRRSSLEAATSLARVAAIQMRGFGASISRIPKVREVGTLIVAAAGLLALALFLRQQPEPVERAEASEFATVKDEASSLILMDEGAVYRQQRETFLTNPPVDMIRVPCRTENEKDVVGELLWSDRQQKGFVSLSGLEANHPSQFQYQVWIVDSNQKYPVSGGVFDVADRNRAVVRLRPNVNIRNAVEFIVTRERPGGVMKSSRKNIVAVAKAKK